MAQLIKSVNVYDDSNMISAVLCASKEVCMLPIEVFYANEEESKKVFYLARPYVSLRGFL